MNEKKKRKKMLAYFVYVEKRNERRLNQKLEGCKWLE